MVLGDPRERVIQPQKSCDHKLRTTALLSSYLLLIYFPQVFTPLLSATLIIKIKMILNFRWTGMVGAGVKGWKSCKHSYPCMKFSKINL